MAKVEMMNGLRFTKVLLLVGSVLGSVTHAAGFQGSVLDEAGEPIVGAMVTARFSTPFQERTVFTNDQGGFELTGLPESTDHLIRVRRIGWHDVRSGGHMTAADELTPLDFTMVRHTDPALVAAQLPANHWYELLLNKLESEHDREQFVRQCTFCHQQGNPATRLQRDPEEWSKILALMARMGAGLDEDLRERVPELFNTAYDPATAVPALTEGWQDPDFAPPPSENVRQAVVDEFQLGGRSSMQHDMIVHPSGDIYSVDMTTDTLFRLDPGVPGGSREWFSIPREDVPLGGVMGLAALPSNSEMHVGPHSLQADSKGAIWITLATGNRLAKFDPSDDSFTIEPLPGGIYPHTLRIDDRDRVWYTIAGSNHVGMYDPDSGQHETIRVPARSFGEAVMLRMIPAFIWLSQYIDLSGALGAGGGEGVGPVPYGIDIAPNGDIWFSQLNAHRIGRIDPETFEVAMIDTPFTAPRRMRFDSKGNLWIPGFSSNLISKFNPETLEFQSYTMPTEPLGTETPYSLNVDRRTDTVWICGTNSDTLISFDTASEVFTIYPLPTQVTYTRDIDFDSEGRVWTSNSNVPAWQIETGIPRVLRLSPRGTPTSEVSGGQ
ncbi:MAG: carboxypeptidase regulatory-like domain-containing protein [Gammaproteobacteria bacterium]|nr:carboxypeptidase regulatory-like domain-containing protein [Gammaproteobacteria bacterium]